MLTAFLLPASPAAAFVFGEPTVRQIAPETVPFDWSVHKCTNDDIPDQPARAFREANGTINFVDTHHTMWRFTTTNLTTLTRRCSPVMMNSHNNTDPAMYDDKEWIGATWTSDGTTVYGFTHSEYQGYRHAPGGYCICSGEPFTDKAEVLAERDHARHVDQRRVDLLAHDAPEPSGRRLPDPVGARQRPAGLLPASHIVRGQDGWHYMMARVMGGPSRLAPACCARGTSPTRLLARVEWVRFTVTFPSPYLNTLDPAQHVCQPARTSTSGRCRRASAGAPTSRSGSWSGAPTTPTPSPARASTSTPPTT